MKINLGYVCTTVSLDITSSSSFTYTNFSKTNDYNKLNDVIISNLVDLEKILKYNISNNIYFFRLTSKLIPLATKEDVPFDYIKPYKKYFDRLKPLCKKIRIDVHPDQFTVLNSTNKEVVRKSILELEYHYNILEALGIENKVIILHIGSSVLGKNNSISRFINNFNKLPEHLKKCIVIENDDKVYTINDCLKINKITNIPVVLDYHHHICNNDGTDINNVMKDILNSWIYNKPKMHFSSPKSKLKKEYRSHHDYIDPYSFITFLNILSTFNTDVDIMIEAKKKDEAMFRLIRQLKYLTNYKIDETTINIKKR